MKLALVCWVAVGCSFQGAPGVGGEDPSGPDGSGGDGNPGVCVWDERVFFDPCGDDRELFSDPVAGTTNLDAALVFNTTSGTFEGEMPGSLITKQGEILDEPVSIWLVDNLIISAGVRILGDRPLLIAATGDIQVTSSGTLSVSSAWRPDQSNSLGGTYIEGAGGFGGNCAARNGMNNLSGAGGGAGAGFGSSGGDGGEGEGGVAEPVEGAEEVELSSIDKLRGGCVGGRGGEAAIGQPAPQPPAGGGLLLSALGAVEIAGTLSANGAGGVGQFRPARNGAGGGASGGLIVLQGSSLEVSGNFFANGGGGGGGANSQAMENNDAVSRAELTGVNGQDSTDHADGGTGQAGGMTDNGGHGGVEGDEAEDAKTSNDGGAGGGGGVGYVVFVTKEPTDVRGAPVAASPEPISVSVDFEEHEQNNDG